MVLVKTKVGFPFVKGINTKVSEKTQAAGELRDCVNFSVNKVGRLDQRKGFERIGRDVVGVGDSSSATIESAFAVANLHDEVILFDGKNAYSKTSDDKWVEVDSCLNVRSSTSAISSETQATAGNASYGVSGNFEYIAWAEQPYSTDGIGSDHGTGVRPDYVYTVRDRATGATVIPPTKFATCKTEFTHDGTASWTNNSNTVSFTGYPEKEIGVGDFISLPSWAESEPKRLVTQVNTGSVNVAVAMPGTGTAESIVVHKGAGQDSLYFSPKVRVLCPVGTNHVHVLYQDGLDIRYLYADTSDGTAASLELANKGLLETMGKPYPAWDADWFLSTNSSVTDSDDAAIAVTYYESSSPYGVSDRNLRLKLYNIGSFGILSSYISLDASGSRTITPVRRDEAGGFVGNKTWVWQPFLKVAHDETSGVPQASRGSDIILGYTYVDTGGDEKTRIMAYDDAGTLSFSEPLHDSSYAGADSGWIMARAGVGYDSLSIYVMAELHSDTGTSVSPFEPQRHAVLSSRFFRSSGSQASGVTSSLWTNATVHSDGFMSGGKCYFWLTSAQGVDKANSITFLADTDGRIHGHGVYGAPSICSSLEYVQQAGEGSVTKMTSRVQRNMTGLVSSVTPEAWSVAGSSKFSLGSSVLGVGSQFFEYNQFAPAVLSWDTSPPRPFRSVEAYGSLYVGGGLLWSYDGSRLVESDFLLSPQITGGGQTTGSGLPFGNYSYYVCYEYRDAKDILHSSIPVLYNTTISESDGSAEVYFDIRLNQLTNHRFRSDGSSAGTYVIAIYRTNTDGDIFYLHKTIGNEDWGTGFAPSDSSGNRIVKIAYRDSDSTQHSASNTQVLVWDSIGVGNAGGPVSSPIDITRHKDCLLVSNTENVLYSSMGLSGVIAPVFPQTVGEDSGRFGLKADGVDSPITHVASNGQTFVFFTGDDGYSSGGEGPDMFGDGSWVRPEKIAPGQGVRPDGFIAAIPQGVIYSSLNGINLVGRDLSVSSFGNSVDNYATLASANDPVVLDSFSEVWIPLSGGNGRVVLVFNYLTKTWYRHEFGSSAFHPGKNIEAISWVDKNNKEVLFLADSSGYLYRQKDDTDAHPYIDKIGASGTGYTIDSELTTGWLQVPGYGEKVRCYKIAVLGTWSGGSGTTDLTISTSTNFNNASSNEEHSASVTPTGIGAESPQDGGSQVLIKPKNQKMESISVKISTSTSSVGSTVEGWSLEGLILEIGKRQDKTRFKQGAAKTVAAT